jgi:hypothetical protein
VAGACECGNEPSGYIKFWGFLEWLTTPSASQEGLRSMELVHPQSHSYALFACLYFIRGCQISSTAGRRRQNHILFRPRDKHVALKPCEG